MATTSSSGRADDLQEIADILAMGLMRLWARKSSPEFPYLGESSLETRGHQSGHANPDVTEKTA